MSDLRATKSGIARDVQQKLAGKYDKDVAAYCMQWIQRTTGVDMDTSGDMEAVHICLKDGYVLSQLINKIIPDKIRAEWLDKRASSPFKQMEQINRFLELLKKDLGISQHDCFATADLYEKQNMVQVITCIESLGRKLLTMQTPVQGFGKKEAESNQREFTEEQLKQGQNVIGLQMGSNKGASQAGQSFGKTRMIVD